MAPVSSFHPDDKRLASPPEPDSLCECGGKWIVLSAGGEVQGLECKGPCRIQWARWEGPSRLWLVNREPFTPRSRLDLLMMPDV